MLLGAQPSIVAGAARRESIRRGLLPQSGAHGESVSRRLHPLPRQSAARHLGSRAGQGLEPDQRPGAEQGPGEEGRGGADRSRSDRAAQRRRHHEEGLRIEAMATHRLDAAPETVLWGFFDAKLPPQLTVNSGDTVTISTVSGTFGHLPKADS